MTPNRAIWRSPAAPESTRRYAGRCTLKRSKGTRGKKSSASSSTSVERCPLGSGGDDRQGLDLHQEAVDEQGLDDHAGRGGGEIAEAGRLDFGVGRVVVRGDQVAGQLEDVLAASADGLV